MIMGPAFVFLLHSLFRRQSRILYLAIKLVFTQNRLFSARPSCGDLFFLKYSCTSLKFVFTLYFKVLFKLISGKPAELTELKPKKKYHEQIRDIDKN